MDWLINIIYYVVPFLILLGVLVFVHELGHFIVARFCGVKVEAFSIGFGKEIWGFQDKKGTRWKLSLIPLGGYCQFLGDEDASSTTSNADKLSEEDKKFAFEFQSPIKKLLIAIAGPGANYLFAILVFTSVFYFIGKVDFPPVVGEVITGGAAQKAGIIEGDRIIEINGNKITSFDDIAKETTLSPNNHINLVIIRNNKEIKLNFDLIPLKDEKSFNNTEARPMLGIRSVTATEVMYKELSFWQSFRDASLETWRLTEMTIRGVGQMITGKRGAEDVGGIVRIAEMSGEISKKSSFVDFIIFMALLSVNLGLINLFPIPVLDGGHVIIYVLEIITGKEMNAKVKDVLFRFGLFLILALMVFATYNDIARLVNRWFA